MSDERPDEDAPIELRRAKGIAMVGFILLITSLWMDWWQVRLEAVDGTPYEQHGVGPFRPDTLIADAWGPWLAGALVAVAALGMFVRLAGRSWLYEPQTWQKTLLAAAVLILLAAVSTGWWPNAEPIWDQFWSTLELANEDGTPIGRVKTRPGLGWWTALTSAIVFVGAWWVGQGADTP